MPKVDKDIRNERLINWFVEYCQRKCGQVEISQDRSLPLVAVNTRSSSQYLPSLPTLERDLQKKI